MSSNYRKRPKVEPSASGWHPSQDDGSGGGGRNLQHGYYGSNSGRWRQSDGYNRGGGDWGYHNGGGDWGYHNGGGDRGHHVGGGDYGDYGGGRREHWRDDQRRGGDRSYSHRAPRSQRKQDNSRGQHSWAGSSLQPAPSNSSSIQGQPSASNNGNGRPSSLPAPEGRTFTELLALVDKKSRSETRDFFSKLSREEKLRVQGFPPGKGKNCSDNPLPDTLPTEVQGMDSDETIKRKVVAAKVALEKTKSKFDPDSDDMSDDSADYPYKGCIMPSTPPEYEAFVLALPYCLLFDASFRVKFPRFKGDERLCWCPCGAYMECWQKFFGLDMSGPSGVCGSKGKQMKEPFALLAHLRDLANKKCAFHFAAQIYLEEYYKDYSGPGLAHPAIYQNKDYNKFQQAKRAINSMNAKVFDDMQKAISEAEGTIRKLEKDKEEREEQLNDLGKINEELMKRNKEYDKTMKSLELNEEEKGGTILSPLDMECYKMNWNSYLDCLRNKAKKNSRIIFEVPINFSLQELFDELDSQENKDKTFLLREFSYRGDPYYHAPKLVNKWKIKQGEAIDMDGVTNQFFSEVWRQMQVLSIDVAGKRVKLFAKPDEGLMLPASNDMIEAGVQSGDIVEHVEKAKRYYRAIGRVMFHSIIRGIPIANWAVPAFYRNVLFRECDLQDDRYPHASVIRDLTANGAHLGDHSTKMVGRKLSTFGFDIDGNDKVITPEVFVSEVLHQYYISDMSIALNGLREGLTLGGYANFPRTLRNVPEHVISTLLFALPSVELKQVYDILKPKYSENCDATIIEIQENFFVDVFKQVIQDRAEENKSFLPKFLWYLTGLPFVPHPLAFPDYSIAVKFEFMEGEKKYPRVWICTKELILDADAYEGNREIFEERFDYCLQQAKQHSLSDA